MNLTGNIAARPPADSAARRLVSGTLTGTDTLVTIMIRLDRVKTKEAQQP
jgi:hypothetical protein